MSQDVIELNGKRYDALTGAYLGKSHVIPRHIVDHHVHGKVIDGFVRPTHHEAPQKATPKPATTAKPAPAPARPQMTDVHQPHHHQPANHLKAHRPEHAKTLMRRAAHKPVVSIKPKIKIQTPAELMAKPGAALMHKRSVYSVDPARKERASLLSKHHAVRHFTTPAIHAVSAEVPVIPVQTTPLHVVATSPVLPSKHHTDIFEAAIARATSHEQPAHKPHRRHSVKRRWLNTLAIVATFLVIGGFVGYLNLPGIELRVASVQAGFSASMPSHTPFGYALVGGIQRSGGTITLSFRSGDSHYRITQQSSNWNSQTLLDNTLALNGDHDTVQKNGQLIYIYKNGGTNAAWVNGGVRYDITGNASLSQDEIAAIATSL